MLCVWWTCGCCVYGIVLVGAVYVEYVYRRLWCVYGIVFVAVCMVDW